MIIVMYGTYHDIEVGDTMYKEVSQDSWHCWLKFFRWAFERGFGAPSLFQDGWAVAFESHSIDAKAVQNCPEPSSGTNSAAEGDADV